MAPATPLQPASPCTRAPTTPRPALPLLARVAASTGGWSNLTAELSASPTAPAGVRVREMGVPWEDASVVVLVEVFMAETDYRREEREVEEGLLPPEELGVEPEDLQAVYQEAVEMLYNGPHNNGSLTTALHTALQNAMGVSFNASAFKLSEMRQISANRPPSKPLRRP